MGLVVGLSAGRWSVNSIHAFVEADPPTPPKDPFITVLDEFEGMWVLEMHFRTLSNLIYISLETSFRQLGV